MRNVIVVALMIALAGCGVEVMTTTAIQGEMQAKQMKAMQGQLKFAADSTAKVNLRRAITTYQAEKGQYPPALDSLVPNYLPVVPMKPDHTPYGYDPNTGQITDQPVEAAPVVAAAVPAGTTPARTNVDIMNDIKTAIDRYGRVSGYYPPTLEALVPTYLSEVPKTTMGQDFVYDCRDGGLYVPGQAPTAVPVQPAYTSPTETAQVPIAARPAAGARGGRGAGGVGGGSGPMGEVMTGIGMQNQLNSMGSSGVDAAGSYSRQKLGNTQQDYNKRQNQAMNNLGL